MSQNVGIGSQHHHDPTRTALQTSIPHKQRFEKTLMQCNVYVVHIVDYKNVNVNILYFYINMEQAYPWH